MKPQGLSTRIALLSIGLLLMVQLASFLVIRSGIERNAQANLVQDLAKGSRIWARLMEQQAQKLRQGASLLAADYGFRSAVADGDRETINSVLDNHGARIGASFVALLDTQFKLRAQTQVQAAHVNNTLTLLRDELTTQGEAIAMVDQVAYQFVMVPLKAPVLMGWVVMGFRLDQASLREMRNVTGLHVVLLAAAREPAQQVLMTTLPAVSQAQAAARLTAGLHAGDQPEQVVLGQEPYEVVRLGADQHGQIAPAIRVDALLMGSLAEAVAPYATVQWMLAIITAAGLVLFALGSMLTARRVVQPLDELVRASERLAQGQYDEPPAHTARRDEVGELARAFDHMRLSIADQQREIRQLAFWDRLTGLPNRVQFRDILVSALAEAARSDQPSEHAGVAVIMMDLDRFKHVNDVLGYVAGDELLKAVAARLAAVVHEGECLARVGGDEFGILLKGCSPEQALVQSRRFLAALEAPMVLGEQTIDLAAGVGVACWPEHAADADQLLSRAEVAMYAAKKDTHVPLAYDPQQDAGSAKTLSLISDLKQALEKQELRLYLQPKIRLDTATLVGAEALVRWQHPSRGLVPPMAFIPFAEQTGFIRHLTQWVFGACASEQPALAALGVQRVSVNLSTRDLLDQDLPDKFDAMLRAHGATAQGICLEITESAIMDDPQRAEGTLNRLAAAGFKLSIDDFGTGYSSLAYLKRLPVHELKIDQSFVKGMTTSEGDAKIVRSTIDLAHNLGLQVVAEGVETPDMANALAGMACDEVQGYHYGRPMPVSEFCEWARQWHAERGPAVPASCQA